MRLKDIPVYRTRVELAKLLFYKLIRSPVMVRKLYYRVRTWELATSSSEISVFVEKKDILTLDFNEIWTSFFYTEGIFYKQFNNTAKRVSMMKYVGQYFLSINKELSFIKSCPKQYLASIIKM